MKTETELMAELGALATVTEDQFEAALAAVVADFTAFFAGNSQPAADPVVSIVTTTQGGVTETFVPEVEPKIEPAD